MAVTKPRFKTTCSGCTEPVKIDRDLGTATVRVPSNGLRGAKHVPAHDVTADLINDDGDLITWDCPACGYADSFDLNDGEPA